jgi:biotin carboxylase
MSILLVATTTGYQTRAFDAAADGLGESLVLATDRCVQLEDPWRDRAVPVRFHDIDRSVRTVVRAAPERGVSAILAVGDRPAVLAAHVAAALGLRWHSPRAAACAANKREMRERLRAAGLPVPAVHVLLPGVSPDTIALPLPLVVKPVVLSGSRGVIRADTAGALAVAVARIRRLLESRDVRLLRDPDGGTVLVEEYLPGDEYAIEGLVTSGRTRVLAVFDKPDPLDGPYFEETIYTTPSRAPAHRLEALARAVCHAVRALGLSDGPIHAECRVGSDEIPYVIEVAARPIGGLCARALRFSDGQATITLEELLMRHARGEPVDVWHREEASAGVMMIPIPTAGVFRGVAGEQQARQVQGITDLRITAKPDRLLLPPPEGATYLGFLFSRTATPDAAEASLRQAHAHLRFRIDRPMSIV